MHGWTNYCITMTSQHIIEEFHISANKVSFGVAIASILYSIIMAWNFYRLITVKIRVGRSHHFVSHMQHTKWAIGVITYKGDKNY